MCSRPNILQHLHGPCSGKDFGEVGWGLSFGTNRITDLDFADDAVIFTERTEILGGLSEWGSLAAWMASFLDENQGPSIR